MTKMSIRTSVLATVIVGLLSGSAIAADKAPRQAEPPKVNAAVMGDQQSFSRFIVTYHDGATARNNRSAITRNMATALSRAGLSSQARPANASYLRKLAIGSDLVKTSRKLDRAEAEAFMRQIAADPAVARVEVDRMRRPVRDVRAPAKVQPQAFTPDDTYYGNYQWHLKAPDGTATANGVANLGGSNVNNAWDLADGNGVVIAVLDTGITEHPDIDTTLADAGYDFITDSFVSGRDTDGRVAGGWDLGDWTTEEPWLSECTNALNPPDDSSWHGTHVAGTAGAELTNNTSGMAGVAYNAKILPVRVLGHCGGYTSDITDAIIWASGGHVDGVPDNTNVAQVINLSLGGTGACSQAEADAIAGANSRGSTVVIAAGNDGDDASGYSPGNCPGVVTVASNGIYSKRAFYSNYGDSVEISAPGGGVYANDGSSGTPINDGFVWQAVNDGLKAPEAVYAYLGMAGTSQASPHVAGVVALMQGARADAGLPALTPDEVLSILQSTAHAPSVPPTQPIGAGIVDAAAAVAAAIEPPCTEDCGPVAIELTNKVPVPGLSGAAGSEKLYSFTAQAGATLSFMTYGGSGNVSVYVSFEAEPSTTDYDSKSTRSGNSETVRFNKNQAQAGVYYVKLVGAGAYSGVTLVARQ